jgi:hypothetical protein
MDQNGEWIQLGYSWPQRVAVPFPSKEVLERAQLEKFRLDHLLQLGRLPFDQVERGSDPPDFIVKTDAGPVALDCAALTIGAQRHADLVVNAIVDRVAKQGGGRFQHLVGCDVFFSFLKGLPSRQDDEAVQQVVEKLEGIEVDRVKIAQFAAEVAKHGFPEQFPPDLGIGGGPIAARGDAEGVLIVHVVPQGGFRPTSPLAERLGFNPYLNYSFPVASVHDQVRRLVEGHDNAATEHLLLVAAAPNLAGLCFPAEASFAAPLFPNRPQAPLQVRYLRRVTLHIWTTCQIVELPIVTVVSRSPGG